MEILKIVTDLRTSGLTGVGARDTCMSKKCLFQWKISTAIFRKILIHNNSQKILLFIVADVGQCVSMQASVLVN